MSELIEIVPSPGTTFSEDEPLEVSIPIVDASAGANESQCRSVASTLTVYKVENAADFDTPPFKLSWCAAEYSDSSCFCQFNTTHFSAYGVVDVSCNVGLCLVCDLMTFCFFTGGSAERSECAYCEWPGSYRC